MKITVFRDVTCHLVGTYQHSEEPAFSILKVEVTCALKIEPARMLVNIYQVT